MKHLIALDEIEAVYWDDGRPDKAIVAADYIVALIGIKTPANLIEFLYTYPGGLIEAYAWAKRSGPHHLNLDGKPPWFSAKQLESAMMTLNKKRGYNLDWIAPLNDELESHVDIVENTKQLDDFAKHISALIAANHYGDIDAEARILETIRTLPRGRTFDEYAINFYGLQLYFVAVSKLLTVAAIANGRSNGWSNWYFDIERKPCAKQTPQLEGQLDITMDIDVSIDIHEASLITPFLGTDDVMRSLEKFSLNGTRCHVDGERICFHETAFVFGDVSEIPRERISERHIATFLTAWGLTEWLREYSGKQTVGFVDGRFCRADLSTNKIVEQLFKYIANDRVGICNRCGRPFIAERVNNDGRFARAYCGNSCTNLASKASKQGEAE